MHINDIHIERMFDSRGEGTIAAMIETEHGNFRASVPSGKSRGANEAQVVSFDDARNGLETFVLPAVRGKRFDAMRTFDDVLHALDHTPRKERLGGNLTLALSVAFCRALAHEHLEEPWQVLRREYFPHADDTAVAPRIFANLINGGAHAANNLSIQEFMVIADMDRNDMEGGIAKLIRFYRALGEHVEERAGHAKLPLGDEGGYSLSFDDNFEPIATLEHVIVRSGLEDDYRIGLDVAATNFYRHGMYWFDGREITTEGMLRIYDEFASQSELLASIEDPFVETDPASFAALREALPEMLVVGDDLTTTDPRRIKHYGEDGTISGVIIKPNQIGTVTETCEAIQTAHDYGVQTIVSHRSGETDDPFIIHLARASNAFGVKIGAPARERMTKYNELIRLYKPVE